MLPNEPCEPDGGSLIWRVIASCGINSSIAALARRQEKGWEGNMRDWTGLEFAKSQRAVETRDKWRTLVVKSSMVTQRPPRLGYR